MAGRPYKDVSTFRYFIEIANISQSQSLSALSWAIHPGYKVLLVSPAAPSQ
jgi:hypothetical protein